MTVNHVIFIILVFGVGLVITAWAMDSSSSFESGTFLFQMLLGMLGIGLVAGGLLWKLVYSLVI